MRDQQNFTIPNCTVDEDYRPPGVAIYLSSMTFAKKMAPKSKLLGHFFKTIIPRKKNRQVLFFLLGSPSSFQPSLGGTWWLDMAGPFSLRFQITSTSEASAERTAGVVGCWRSQRGEIGSSGCSILPLEVMRNTFLKGTSLP